jgi:hypothetical protein
MRFLMLIVLAMGEYPHFILHEHDAKSTNFFENWVFEN